MRNTKKKKDKEKMMKRKEKRKNKNRVKVDKFLSITLKQVYLSERINKMIKKILKYIISNLHLLYFIFFKIDIIKYRKLF